MSSSDQNLSHNRTIDIDDIASVRISVVVSSWNADITSSLLAACRDTLIEQGVLQSNIKLSRVPGAYELPLGAKWACSYDNPDAVICLGCVIRGETEHDRYISQSTAQALMLLGLEQNIPIVFGVLTPNNKMQALDRAGGKYGNKGVEAANTALEMIRLYRLYQRKTI